MNLDLFEGPLDLLLHLVKRQELNIHDIPVSLITSQYLEYLERMEELNLAVASEFFLMAATLLQIKANSLLPRPDQAQLVDDQEEDPRQMLAAKLLEYEKFRVLAERLSELQQARALCHAGPSRLSPPPQAPRGEENLYQLMAAMGRLLVAEGQEKPHEIEPDEGNVEEMAAMLLAGASDCPRGVVLEDLLSALGGRARMVAMFVALLELVRAGQLVVSQRRPFSRVRIRRPKGAQGTTRVDGGRLHGPPGTHPRGR